MIPQVSQHDSSSLESPRFVFDQSTERRAGSLNTINFHKEDGKVEAIAHKRLSDSSLLSGNRDNIMEIMEFKKRTSIISLSSQEPSESAPRLSRSDLEYIEESHEFAPKPSEENFDRENPPTETMKIARLHQIHNVAWYRSSTEQEIANKKEKTSKTNSSKFERLWKDWSHRFECWLQRY